MAVDHGFTCFACQRDFPRELDALIGHWDGQAYLVCVDCKESIWDARPQAGPPPPVDEPVWVSYHLWTHEPDYILGLPNVKDNWLLAGPGYGPLPSRQPIAGDPRTVGELRALRAADTGRRQGEDLAELAKALAAGLGCSEDQAAMMLEKKLL